MQHDYELFIGGIGEDDKLVFEGQVLYSENLDLTGNSDFINLAPKPKSLFVSSDNPEVMYLLKRGKNILITGLDNNEIYYGGNKVYDANHEVKAFWSNSTNLLWVDASEDIFYIPLVSVSQADWTPYVVAGETNLANASGDSFVVENEGTSYVAFGVNIYEINNTDGLLVNTFSFCYDEIVGMTTNGSQIKIYQRDGRVFLWNGVADSPSQSTFLNTSIAIVNQFGSKESLLGEGTLYNVNGFEADKSASSFNSDVLESAKLRIVKRMPNALGFLKGMTYAGGDGIIDLEDSTGEYSFGNNAPVITHGIKKQGFPEALNAWITTSSDDSGYDTVYGLKTGANNESGTSDVLYIAYENHNGLYGVDTVDLDKQNYTTSEGHGLLVLPKFDGGSKNTEKTLNKIKVRADFGNDNGDLIFFSVEKDGLLKPLVTEIDDSKIGNHIGEGIYELIVKRNFYDKTIAIVFDQNSDYAKNDALKLYSVTLDYDPTKR